MESRKVTISFLIFKWSLFVKFWFPSPLRMLSCRFWFKLTKWFCRRWFVNDRVRPVIWKTLNPLHLSMFCAKFGLVKIDPVFLEKATFNFCQCILLFRNYLPFIRKNSNPHHPRILSLNKFGLILGKDIFKFRQWTRGFPYFIIISPLKRAYPFI